MGSVDNVDYNAGMNDELPLIQASEIGSYVYCNRQWWLERVEEIEVTNPQTVKAIERGVKYHQNHAETVKMIESQQTIVIVLVLLVAAGAAGWIFAWLMA